MRPTPTLTAIAERADQFIAGDSRENISQFILGIIREAMRAKERELAEAGLAFVDQDKTEVAVEFSINSPIAFLIALPEIIGANAMRFDDEEILEECISRCLGKIFAGQGEPVAGA